MKLPHILIVVITLILPLEVQATPLTERTTLDAVEVFEVKAGDRKLVCARFAGDSGELTAGSIEGADFVPMKDKIALLRRRIKKASGTKRDRLQRELRTLQKRMKRCRNEEGLSPLVVEEFNCGHRLVIEHCPPNEECFQDQLQAPTGSGSSVVNALNDSGKLCERYLSEMIRYEESVGARLGDQHIFRLREGQGCSLFGCGITPEGRSWNIYIYKSAGVITACKPGNQCEEILVEGSTIQPSWDLARQVAVANCEAEAQELASGLLAFDGYTSVTTSIACYPTLFDRKLGLK